MPKLGRNTCMPHVQSGTAPKGKASLKLEASLFQNPRGFPAWKS